MKFIIKATEISSNASVRLGEIEKEYFDDIETELETVAEYLKGSYREVRAECTAYPRSEKGKVS